MEKIKSFAKKHPIWSVIIVLVVIGFIGSLFSSPNTDNNSQPTTTTQTQPNQKTNTQTNQNINTQNQEETLEYILATLNAGKYVEKDDLTINRFRYLLDILDKKTKNTKEEIADMSVAALEKVAKEKYGLDITLLELMEGANNSIPEEAIGTDSINYAEIVVLYIELIK